MKLSIQDLDLQGKRVFIRVDFNVPLANAGTEITSDKRIRASLPTIKYALEHGAGVVLRRCRTDQWRIDVVPSSVLPWRPSANSNFDRCTDTSSPPSGASFDVVYCDIG